MLCYRHGSNRKERQAVRREVGSNSSSVLSVHFLQLGTYAVDDISIGDRRFVIEITGFHTVHAKCN